LLMTPLVNVYFLNLPVQGDAESPVAYFKGTKKQHLMGLLGGAMWGLGTAAFLAGASGGYPDAPRFLGVEALGYGFGVTGAICGLLVWGEQAEAGKAKGMLMGGAAVLAVAAALVFLGS
jgi:glucose uptake protein